MNKSYNDTINIKYLNTEIKRLRDEISELKTELNKVNKENKNLKEVIKIKKENVNFEEILNINNNFFLEKKFSSEILSIYYLKK